MAKCATATLRPQGFRVPAPDGPEECLAASHLQLTPQAIPTPPHDDAVGRLETVLVEQDRRRRRYEAAIETSLEPVAYARLCEANERVATRESWLEWIDPRWDRGGSTALARGAR
jgi:hypothetical protein